MSGAGTARRHGSTVRLLGLGGLALGAVLALVAGSRPWWRAAGTGVSVSFSGTESTGGLAQALALVVLAGALLILVLRSRGRRVLGVLLALAGAGAVVVGLARLRPTSQAVQSRVLEVSLADQFALVGTPWPWVYAVAGLLAVAAAVLTTATAPRWPSRTARYERPAVAGGSVVETPAVVAPSAAEDDPAVLWRALDAGVDPTDVARPEDGDGHRDADHNPQPPPPGDPNPPTNAVPDQDDAPETASPTHPGGSMCTNNPAGSQ